MADEDALLLLARSQADQLRRRISALTDLAWRPWAGVTHAPELRLALGRIADGLDVCGQVLVQSGNQQQLQQQQHHLPGIQRSPAYGRLEELLRLDVNELELETAWNCATALQRVLVSIVAISDPNEICNKLEDELASADPREVDQGNRHNRVHHAKLSELRERGRRAPLVGDDLSAAVSLLAHLYAAQLDETRVFRAAADAKALYFWPMILVLSIALAGAILVAYVAAPDLRPLVLLASFAGALGSTLSGILKLRDRITHLADMRGLQSQIFAQALVGAGAGLVMLLLLQSQILVIGSAGADLSFGGSGLLAFVAGFSEPFFLGVIGHVADMGAARAPQRTHSADRE